MAAEYFTNRQDRYYLISSPELVSYYRELTTALGKFCYRLQPDFSKLEAEQPPCGYVREWPGDNHLSTPLECASREKLYRAAQAALLPLIWKQGEKVDTKPCLYSFPPETATATAYSEPDTALYPLAQLTPLTGPHLGDRRLAPRHGSSFQCAVLVLLDAFPRCASWTFAT